MRRFRFVAILTASVAILAAACTSSSSPAARPASGKPYLVVLGNAQDGGYPQAGCNRPHCEPGWNERGRRRFATSLALVDPVSGERWLFEATPSLPEQLRMLDQLAPPDSSPGLAGIFLTHAHIGHYAGLIHLGREVMGARNVAVYAMPRMAEFLRENGPWSQLVELSNVEIRGIEDLGKIRLNDRLSVTPFLVPHRDEFSETVGYRIDGPARSAVFIPDIDKWEKWDRSVEEVIRGVDVAWLDGTFFAEGELPGRNMADIPHPFIAESMARFAALSTQERRVIRFIHLNHTNPALQPGSLARTQIETAGFAVAEQGERFEL